MNDNAKQREELVQMFRDYCTKVGGWVSQTWKADLDDDYVKSAEYQAELKKYNDFVQQDDIKYDAVFDYARDLYDRYDKTDKLLDEKADSIIKYLGGGSALATFGALASIKTDSPFSAFMGMIALVFLIPSLVAATRAVYFAIKVRRPRSAATLPPVSWAVSMADWYKTDDKIKTNIWLIFQPICEAYNHRNCCKAKLVHNAHSCYQWAIGLLVLPVIGIAITLIVGLSQGFIKQPPAEKKAEGTALVRMAA